jgi:hypothetical protein
LAGVLGGDRTSSVLVTADTSPGLSDQATLDIGFGMLSMSSQSGVTSDFTTTYTNVGGIDVSAADFKFNIFSNDNGGTFSLLLDDGTNSASTTLSILAAETGDKIIPIFGNLDFSGLVLGSIDVVEFSFQGNSETDITLQGAIFFENAVPEPSGIAIWTTLLGIVAVGIALRGRSRRAA